MCHVGVVLIISKLDQTSEELIKFEQILQELHSAPVAQLDRVSDYGSEGQGFESSRARQKHFLPIIIINIYFSTILVICKLVISMNKYLIILVNKSYDVLN